MAELIDAMPGVELPVGEVTSRLATMWESGPAGSPTEFRASQMNVVLHFGLDVSPEDARTRFDAVLSFSQRYPSRIIVLCPTREVGDGSMSAKLFSQCYIGKSQREMCCCEALILGYKSEDCGHLSNQVSVWLETDLPTYHWFSGVPASRIEKYFDNLLVGVRRCVYDSSIEAGDLSKLNWPDPNRVSDLARARLLPVRQAIGQFMSGYSVESLIQGLQAVTIWYCESMSGEGQQLMNWVKDCLDAAGTEHTVDYQLKSCDESKVDSSLVLEFTYQDSRYFSWRKCSESNVGEIRAYLGKNEEVITTRIKTLAPEQALSEALFF